MISSAQAGFLVFPSLGRLICDLLYRRRWRCAPRSHRAPHSPLCTVGARAHRRPYERDASRVTRRRATEQGASDNRMCHGGVSRRRAPAARHACASEPLERRRRRAKFRGAASRRSVHVLTRVEAQWAEFHIEMCAGGQDRTGQGRTVHTCASSAGRSRFDSRRDSRRVPVRGAAGSGRAASGSRCAACFLSGAPRRHLRACCLSRRRAVRRWSCKVHT
ncbi:hypothetical protein BC834DRAFT_694217 [Gloeopeniophorella convolvens]|nr:hypothetical protein BC834DRAFT_694217 [Gloeopeniophorella convolvens]